MKQDSGRGTKTLTERLLHCRNLLTTKVFNVILSLIGRSKFYTQDGKPTKEQTIEFIQSFYKNKEIGVSYYNKKYKESVGGNNKDFVLVFSSDLCQLTIDYVYNYTFQAYDEDLSANDITKKHYVIYLDEIESISYFVSELFEEYNDGTPQTIYSFTFNHKPGAIKQKGKVVIPFEVYSCSPQNCDIGEPKIFKAFNHLRKLCGAPEPISFD